MNQKLYIKFGGFLFISLFVGLYIFYAADNAETKVFDIRIETTVVNAVPESGLKSYRIFGKTTPNTKSVYINDVPIQNYFEGTESFEYIVSEDTGTLKEGMNEFKIQTMGYDGTTSEPKYVDINNAGITSVPLEGGGAEVTGSISTMGHE